MKETKKELDNLSSQIAILNDQLKTTEKELSQAKEERCKTNAELDETLDALRVATDDKEKIISVLVC